MKALYPLAAACALVALAGCNKGERTETADTGTAKATVSTNAPPAQVTNAQLETQAVEAATAASTPVDGSGPVKSVTPPAAPAKK
jgi:hypothetical protein